MGRLDRSFYVRDCVTVARELLGQELVCVRDGVRTSGVIVETEAYLGAEDKAAHTYGGRRTSRNESMYRIGGTAYVYFIYGTHWCLNVVAGGVDEPVAALIRALEPVDGMAAMRRRRAKAKKDTDLCSGPGKLCGALGIDRSLDGHDLVAGDGLWLERRLDAMLPADRVVETTRVGVDYAGEWAAKPLRFYVKGNPHVSRK